MIRIEGCSKSLVWVGRSWGNFAGGLGSVGYFCALGEGADAGPSARWRWPGGTQRPEAWVTPGEAANHARRYSLARGSVPEIDTPWPIGAIALLSCALPRPGHAGADTDAIWTVIEVCDWKERPQGQSSVFTDGMLGLLVLTNNLTFNLQSELGCLPAPRPRTKD